jgi:urate oxidase
MMASSVTCTWKYAFQPMDYEAAFTAVRQALLDGVFGPPKGGVYSPGVQYTLYQMGMLALQRVPQVRRGCGVGAIWGWRVEGATGGELGR